MVFVVQVPDGVSPTPGDDATHVLKISLDDVDKHDFFIDHKTIIHDFIKSRQKQMNLDGSKTIADEEPFKRSYCPY